VYDRISDLPLRVADAELVRRERETSSGFTRVTTTVVLRGDGRVGRGEDVTYDAEDHDAWQAAGPPDLAGDYEFDGFSEAVGERSLFPDPPGRDTARPYRRWAVESAALDLALRQADTDLGAALDRSYDPLRFVVSTRLDAGDGPPTADRVARWLDVDPTLEFKLDPTPDWTAELVADLADTDAVRVLDLKAAYEGTEVDNPPDPELYELVLDGFPEAVVEDPGLVEETRRLFDGEHRRVSWDYPITGVESVRELPFEPGWLNVKPSRFGTVASLLATIEYCRERDISLYGGGQFELGPGRAHVQGLASLFYPEGPNDVAPRGYNDPEPSSGLTTSPLAPAGPLGLDWRAGA
jgi:hypothetical protein